MKRTASYRLVNLLYHESAAGARVLLPADEEAELRELAAKGAAVKELLRDMGLDSYDPIQIIEKTHGRTYDDAHPRVWVTTTHCRHRPWAAICRS